MTFRRIAATVSVAGFVVLALLTAQSAGLFRGSAPHAGPGSAAQTVIAVDAQNRLYVNTIPTRPEDLVGRVRRAAADTRDRRVYLRADRNARYATVLDAMEELRTAGIDVHLVTDRP